MDDVIAAVLESSRGLVVAAAGCGKTELIARTVAHPSAGRQLVLTHTHAGVAALRGRFDKLKIAPERYHLDTIASWSMRYGLAYPAITGLEGWDEANPQWASIYPAAGTLVATALGAKVVAASYDGVLVDEYQDCSASQHAIIAALADTLPVRVVGDPLQAIFGFRADDPLVDWGEVESFFEHLPGLITPHRWRKANTALGDWLLDAREELRESGQLTLTTSAPVAWSGWSADAEVEACREWRGERGVVGIKRATMPSRYVRTSSLLLATRLSGMFHMVEAFDDRQLPQMVERWAGASGGEIVADLHTFVKERMVHVGPALNDLVEAVSTGRSTHRFEKHLDHRDRLVALARDPTPTTALAVLEGFRAERGWTVYRPDGFYQLRSALQESVGVGMDHLPEALAVIRTRARHRGRMVPWRTLGTTLLLKGLEFPDALVLDADEFSRNELYVAITRGARSLRILSDSRVIRPAS